MLSVRTARDGDRVLVEIGDNGTGISEAAAHVLEPFSTTKPVGKAPASGSTAAGGSASSASTATCA